MFPCRHFDHMNATNMGVVYYTFLTSVEEPNCLTSILICQSDFLVCVVAYFISFKIITTQNKCPLQCTVDFCSSLQLLHTWMWPSAEVFWLAIEGDVAEYFFFVIVIFWDVYVWLTSFCTLAHGGRAAEEQKELKKKQSASVSVEKCEYNTNVITNVH